MAEWVLSIIGVIFLGVALDIVIPDGKTNGFIKSIFSIIFMFVVINPIIKWVNKTDVIDLSNVQINEDYQIEINNHRLLDLKFQIENHLICNGINGVEVEVKGYSTNNDIIISQINVRIDNLVIIDNVEHINKYKLITTLIKEKVGVDEKNIVYG